MQWRIDWIDGVKITLSVQPIGPCNFASLVRPPLAVHLRFRREGRGTIVDGRRRAADCVDLAPSRRLRQPLQQMAALNACGTSNQGDSRLTDRLLHARHRDSDGTLWCRSIGTEAMEACCALITRLDA